ncbi:Actin- protein 2/3 complex subunit 3 [Cichlidogyrus casuarinus]|uniref:Actin-related protein 2/3 complex subunit 3 n=1 Tax=Cichlidogyrus casuarinus TaxID=1844966 RepID=A0ABD2Q671_9PLAT
MDGFHSEFTDVKEAIGNAALLPLRTKQKGPALAQADLKKDIIDEAIYYFKSLIFFRNFEIKSNSDRVLVYLILYITECLKKFQRCNNKATATREMTNMGQAKFPLPGENGFPLGVGNMFQKPRDQAEADKLRAYFTQLRLELGQRMVEKVYPSDSSEPSKWWLCFSKRKFLDQSLSAPGAL